jgi:hypothetical protein
MVAARSSSADLTTITYINWSSVIAGAIAAAALAFVLHSFAIGIGLSVSSTAPTWRDASFALVFMSGLYLLLVAVLSYGFGAYVASRLRPRDALTGVDVEFRDGMHGLLVWALATLLSGLIAFAAAQLIPQLAAPSGSSHGPSASVGAENIVAYDIDRLLRSDRRPPGDTTAMRAEVGRILLTASSHRGMLADDKAYLTHLVAQQTGLGPTDAQTRVNDVTARAKQNLDRARRVALLIAFMAGAAALIGGVAAWYAAVAASRHREGVASVHPILDWGKRIED